MARRKMLLIRDDDVNFFTAPARLEELYSFLFQAGIPVNFAVIPAINAAATTESPDFGPGSYEPFLPPAVAGNDCEYSLADNQELCSFFQAHRGTSELLMHGCDHKAVAGRYEFDSGDEAAVKAKIARGRAIMAAAFACSPQTFVAPQDQYSPVALRCLREDFALFSLGWIDRHKLPWRTLPAYLWKKARKRNYLWSGRLLLTEHPGCIFSRFRDTAVECERLRRYIASHDFSIIVVHHWEFYQADGTLDSARYGLFTDLMVELSRQHDFVTFSALRASFA